MRICRLFGIIGFFKDYLDYLWIICQNCVAFCQDYFRLFEIVDFFSLFQIFRLLQIMFSCLGLYHVDNLKHRLFDIVCLWIICGLLETVDCLRLFVFDEFAIIFVLEYLK